MIRLSEHTFAAGPVPLHYAQVEADGPPLVLLHGVSRRWQDWRTVLPHLSQFGPIYAVDARGHGQSARAVDGSYRVVDYVADAVRFLDQVVPRPALVVGHSLGAMVAAAVAALRPERVRAVVLEDPPFESMGRRIATTAYPDLFRAYHALAGQPDSVESITAALASTILRAPGGSEVRLGAVRDAVTLRFAASCLKRLDPAVMAPLIAGHWLDGYDVSTTLRGVACPALFLQADPTAGGTLPDDYADELDALLPQGVRLRMAGVGHQIHGAAPERFLRVVTEFLASLD